MDVIPTDLIALNAYSVARGAGGLRKRQHAGREGTREERDGGRSRAGRHEARTDLVQASLRAEDGNVAVVTSAASPRHLDTALTKPRSAPDALQIRVRLISNPPRRDAARSPKKNAPLAGKLERAARYRKKCFRLDARLVNPSPRYRRFPAAAHPNRARTTLIITRPSSHRPPTPCMQLKKNVRTGTSLPFPRRLFKVQRYFRTKVKRQITRLPTP